jgi:hypothetical protein
MREEEEEEEELFPLAGKPKCGESEEPTPKLLDMPVEIFRRIVKFVMSPDPSEAVSFLAVSRAFRIQIAAYLASEASTEVNGHTFRALRDYVVFSSDFNFKLLQREEHPAVPFPGALFTLRTLRTAFFDWYVEVGSIWDVDPGSCAASVAVFVLYNVDNVAKTVTYEMTRHLDSPPWASLHPPGARTATEHESSPGSELIVFPNASMVGGRPGVLEFDARSGEGAMLPLAPHADFPGWTDPRIARFGAAFLLGVFPPFLIGIISGIELMNSRMEGRSGEEYWRGFVVTRHGPKYPGGHTIEPNPSGEFPPIDDIFSFADLDNAIVVVTECQLTIAGPVPEWYNPYEELREEDRAWSKGNTEALLLGQNPDGTVNSEGVLIARASMIMPYLLRFTPLGTFELPGPPYTQTMLTDLMVEGRVDNMKILFQISSLTLITEVSDVGSRIPRDVIFLRSDFEIADYFFSPKEKELASGRNGGDDEGNVVMTFRELTEYFNKLEAERMAREERERERRMRREQTLKVW